MISETTIRAIKDLSIEEVVSKYITLKPKGSKLEACCPFHNEKTPSFSVNNTKGYFKCFGCGESGDGIAFVQKLNNMNFYEAIERMATDHNIELIEEDSKLTPEERKYEKDRKTQASELLHTANEFFKKQALPMDYLIQERKLTQDTITEWGIGLAPDSFHSLPQLQLFAEHLQLAVDISLLNKKEGKIFDFFINRLTIPIRNHVGQLLSFGARKLPTDTNENSPKYLNGKDSFLYNKSHVLFGLDRAVKTIGGEGYVFLVEGYFDVIKMHQHDWTNTVATCGTALTDSHCKLLKRYASSAVLLRDGDKAGQKAMLKDVPVLIENGFQVSIILLPDGEDPDSFLDKDEIDIDKKVDGVKWYIEQLQKKYFDQTIFIEKSTTFIATIPSDISRDIYLDWFCKHFKLPKKIVTDTVKKAVTILHEPAKDKNTMPDDERMPDWVDANQLYTEGFVMNSNDQIDKIGIYYKSDAKPVARLTNYVVKPLFFIMDPTNSRRLVEVYNGRRNNVVELPNKAFTSQDAFETELVGKGAFYSENGFAKQHFKRLVNWLSDNMLNVHTLNTLGWQPEGFFAFSNLAVQANEEGVQRLAYDEYGIVKVGDKAYLSEGASKLNEDTRAEDNMYENDMYLKYVESSMDLRQWADLFYKVYEEDAMFGIAFIFIAAFKDIVTKIAKCPHLYCYGPKGSGKSEFAESLMYFFFSGKNSEGKLIQGYNLNPGQGTPFSFFSRQRRFRNALMLFNEYDPNSIEFWKKGAFKSSYDGEGREIGSGDTGKKRKTEIQKTNVVSMLAGQYLDTTDDGAVLSRSVPCKFSLEKNKNRSQEQKENFRAIKEAEQKGLSSLVADLYKYRKVVAAELKDHYWITQKDLTDAMRAQGKQVEARLISNYSLVLSISEIMGKQLSLPFKISALKDSVKRRMVMQSDVLRDSNALNTFWQVVETLFDDGQLIADIHFKLKEADGVFIQQASEKYTMKFTEKRRVMYLRFNVIYERFAKRYREVYGKNATSQDTLLVYLQDQKYFVGLCPATRFKDKKTSAYIIYYDSLADEMNVNFEKIGGIEDGNAVALEEELMENMAFKNEKGEKIKAEDDLPF